jgi:GNAT superfamily N-acetyltransferase
MASAMNLPEGSTARPLTRGDIDDVIAMVNRCELADIGETMWERADLTSDISTGSFDETRDWLGVFGDAGCQAWAMVLQPARAFVDVDPDRRGLGIGTALRGWTEERARAMGLPRLGQVIEDRRTDVTAMLSAARYERGRSSWVLRMDHPDEPAPAQPPPGIEIRTFDPATQTEVLQMFEDAFMEFDGRSPSTLHAWRAMTVEREGFVPEDMLVAVDAGRVVGGAFLIESDGGIWIDKFATHRDHRHRGIARAMLQTAFRRSWALGSPFTELNTDSRTGALSFYERIGMYIRSSYTDWTLPL